MLKGLWCRPVYSSSFFFSFNWDTSETSYHDSNQLQKFFRTKWGKKISHAVRIYIFLEKTIEIMGHMYPVRGETLRKDKTQYKITYRCFLLS